MYKYFLIFVLLIGGTAFGQGWTRIAGMNDFFYEIKALDGSDTLFVLTRESGMYLSPDGGATWEEIPSPSFTGVASIDIFHGVNSIELLTYTFHVPYLRRSTNFGQSWQAAATNIPGVANCRLLFDYTNRLWAYFGNYLYFSDDQAAHWDSVAAPAGVSRIRDLWISPCDSSMIWIATGTTGVFLSIDRGRTWQSQSIAGDVRSVEGNPQNPRSALAFPEYGSLMWNHGDGLWQDLWCPIIGNTADAAFLDGDSMQMIALAGFNECARNIYRSSDGGQTWRLGFDDLLISYNGWRIQSLNPESSRMAVLLNGGAIIGDALFAEGDFIKAGMVGYYYLLSRQQPYLIWGQSKQGQYVSSDAGQTWSCTPFVGLSNMATEHATRTALYVDVGFALELYCLSFPGMEVDTLTAPPLPHAWIYATTPADTSLLYAVGDYDLAVSRDGGHSWTTHPLPSPDGSICLIHPSSTIPNFAFLTVSYWNLIPFQIWRTLDYGTTWIELTISPYSNHELLGMYAWSQVDAFTDFNLEVYDWETEETWYYYTTNGGISFDSLMINTEDDTTSGFTLHPWGDSTMAYKHGYDSLFITTDRGQTWEFRVLGHPEPDTEQLRYYDGKFGQLIGKYWDDLRAYYYSPALGTPPPTESAFVPNTIQIMVFPNPFNSSTQIEFTLPTAQRVSLRLYDVLGREVAMLMNEVQTPGEHRVTFDAAGLASGVYLCRIEAGGMMQTRKVVLLR